MLDKDRLSDAFTEATAEAASSTDAVNASVGFHSFVAEMLRTYSGDPVAVNAIADMMDERKTAIAQAGVANTMYEPDPRNNGQQNDENGVGLLNTAEPAQAQGTAALPGEGTVEQPTADSPSYASPAPGVTATTVKTDTEIAAEDQSTKQDNDEARSPADKPVIGSGSTGKPAK